MHYRPTVVTVRAGLGSSSLAATAAATLLVLTAALLADIVRYQVQTGRYRGVGKAVFSWRTTMPSPGSTC